MTLVRIWWCLGVALVAVAAWLCLLPAPNLKVGFSMNDKLGHLVGHGGLALWFAGLVPRRNWWKIFLFLLAFGIAIEYAQFHMDLGRDGDPRDVLANSLGAALGLLVGRLGLARWPEVAARVFGRRPAT